MRAKGFQSFHPIYAAAIDARDKAQALSVHLHYALCDVKRREEGWGGFG
jgi:hypothetical protein